MLIHLQQPHPANNHNNINKQNPTLQSMIFLIPSPNNLNVVKYFLFVNLSFPVYLYWCLPAFFSQFNYKLNLYQNKLSVSISLSFRNPINLCAQSVYARYEINSTPFVVNINSFN